MEALLPTPQFARVESLSDRLMVVPKKRDQVLYKRATA